MPSAEVDSIQRQKRSNIAAILGRAGITVDDDRLDALTRAVDGNLLAAGVIARAVAGDRPPPVFRAPEPRPDA